MGAAKAKRQRWESAQFFRNIQRILNRRESCSDLYLRNFTLLKVRRLDWNAVRQEA